VLADNDHVFFEYQPKHTSAAVCDMFRGFTGYIQADAHAVYDAVFRGEARCNPDDDLPEEVGCRVGGGVAAPAPHRPGRAQLTHPVLHRAGSLTAT
jgi:hypothetical protein